MRKLWTTFFGGVLLGAVLFGVVFGLKLPDILKQQRLRKRQAIEQEENRKQKERELKKKELWRQQKLVRKRCRYFFNHLDFLQIKTMRQSGKLNFDVISQILQQLPFKTTSRMQDQALKIISQIIIETNDFDLLWLLIKANKNESSKSFVLSILLNVSEKIILDALQQNVEDLSTNNTKNNFLLAFHKTKTSRVISLLRELFSSYEFQQRAHDILVLFLNYHFSSVGDEKIAQAMMDTLIQQYFQDTKRGKNIMRIFLELDIGLQRICSMSDNLSLSYILYICEQFPQDDIVIRQRAMENICAMIVQTKMFDLLWQNTRGNLSSTTLTEIILRVHEMVDLEKLFVKNWQNIKQLSVKKALFSVLENTQSLDVIHMLVASLEERELEGKVRETLATVLNNLGLTNKELAIKTQQILVAKYQQGNTSVRENILVIFSRLQTKDNTIMAIVKKASTDENRFIKMLAKKTLAKTPPAKTIVLKEVKAIEITNYKAYFLSTVEQQHNKKYVIEKSDLQELDKYGEIDSIHKIADILQGNNEKLSFYAAKMLSIISDTAVIPLLVDTKKRRKSFVVRHTLQVLEGICTQKHENALRYLRYIRDTHRHEFEKLQAAMAIDRIRKREGRD